MTVSPRLVTGEHWTGSPNKSIDQIGKTCPKNVRKLCSQPLRTVFGHLSDIFQHFSDMLSTFPLSGEVHYNPRLHDCKPQICGIVQPSSEKLLLLTENACSGIGVRGCSKNCQTIARRLLGKVPANQALSGQVLRDTARLSQRYPAPSPFSEPSTLGEQGKWRCHTPPQKGYLIDTCAIPDANKAKRVRYPLCDSAHTGAPTRVVSEAMASAVEQVSLAQLHSIATYLGTSIDKISKR